jgi:hypothetical protein
MALFYVSYDLDKPGQNYPNLWKELGSLGARRVQDSLWALKSERTASDLAKIIRQHMDSNDRLVVIKSEDSSWFNLMFNPNDL